MLKSSLSVILCASLFISSCSEKKEEDKKEEKKEGRNEDNGKPIEAELIMPNMLAVLSISGMVCEMDCVKSLEKLLSAMAGVAEINIDFNSEREINRATVKYDNQKITGKEMVYAIEKLNEGAYKVENIDIKKLEEPVVARKKAHEDKNEDEDVITSNSYDESGSGGFALPGILDVFDVL